LRIVRRAVDIDDDAVAGFAGRDCNRGARNNAIIGAYRAEVRPSNAGDSIRTISNLRTSAADGPTKALKPAMHEKNPTPMFRMVSSDPSLEHFF
jgi:hypothetical protein